MESFIYKYINLSILWFTFTNLWKYNIKMSKNPQLMDKMKKEKPLDDFIHTYTPHALTKPYMRRFCDIFAIVTPSIVIFFNYNKIYAYKFLIELGIFHIYKQLICISTRLPPSVDPENLSRKVLGFTIATPIDYGISGHTSIPVLIYFHTNSYFALLNSIIQSILSIITKDHYTIDVIHTWIFIYAIFNRLNFIY